MLKTCMDWLRASTRTLELMLPLLLLRPALCLQASYAAAPHQPAAGPLPSWPAARSAKPQPLFAPKCKGCTVRKGHAAAAPPMRKG